MPEGMVPRPSRKVVSTLQLSRCDPPARRCGDARRPSEGQPRKSTLSRAFPSSREGPCRPRPEVPAAGDEVPYGPRRYPQN